MSEVQEQAGARTYLFTADLKAAPAENFTPFDAAIWTGVGVVGFYAFVANRAAGFSVARSLLACVAFALLGTILVLIKAAVHH